MQSLIQLSTTWNMWCVVRLCLITSYSNTECAKLLLKQTPCVKNQWQKGNRKVEEAIATWKCESYCSTIFQCCGAGMKMWITLIYYRPLVWLWSHNHYSMALSKLKILAPCPSLNHIQISSMLLMTSFLFLSFFFGGGGAQILITWIPWRNGCYSEVADD